jgi:uroporphyrin-3 C-methyltransferase
MNDPKPPDEPSPPTETETSGSTAPPADQDQDLRPESSSESLSTAGNEDRAPQDESPPKSAPPQGEVPSPKSSRPKTGRVLAVIAILIALGAVGASGYVAWLTRMESQGADTLRADLSGNLGQLERKTRELEEQLGALEAARLSDRTQFDELRGQDQQLSGRLNDIESRVERLAAPVSEPEAPDWRLAEVEYLLRVANQQVTLARNPVAALAALAEADKLLLTIDRPGLQPLRQQLADDILALTAVPKADVEGLALRLGSLSKRVDSLPLAGQERGSLAATGETEKVGGWARLKARIGDFFSSIFSVHKATGSPVPMLSAEESFFLRRSLELELQAARIAALSGETSAYKASLDSAVSWTEKYFNPDDASVRAFVSALGELGDRKIEVELPDVSGSLQALTAIQSAENP